MFCFSSLCFASDCCVVLGQCGWSGFVHEAVIVLSSGSEGWSLNGSALDPGERCLMSERRKHGSWNRLSGQSDHHSGRVQLQPHTGLYPLQHQPEPLPTTPCPHVSIYLSTDCIISISLSSEGPFTVHRVLIDGVKHKKKCVYIDICPHYLYHQPPAGGAFCILSPHISLWFIQKNRWGMIFYLIWLVCELSALPNNLQCVRRRPPFMLST